MAFRLFSVADELACSLGFLVGGARTCTVTQASPDAFESSMEEGYDRVCAKIVTRQVPILARIRRICGVHGGTRQGRSLERL
jgi:hypothetical protein